MRVQSKALDWECDPELYLKMINKQEKRFRRKEKVINLLSINHAVGYMLLGDFVTANTYLDAIETSYLSEKNSSYLVYTINRIICLYELGDIEKAELLYETDLVRLNPITKRLRKSVELLIGERYFYLKKYEDCYVYLRKHLNHDLNKRQYLGVLFRLAQMDVMNGNVENAVTKFNKIVKLGNKLWIVNASKEMLEKLNVN